MSDERPTFDAVIAERMAKVEQTFVVAALLEFLKALGMRTVIAKKMVAEFKDQGFDWFNNICPFFPYTMRAVHLRANFSFLQVVKNPKKLPLWEAYLDLQQEGLARNSLGAALIFNIPDHGKWVMHDGPFNLGDGPMLFWQSGRYSYVIERLAVFVRSLLAEKPKLQEKIKTYEQMYEAGLTNKDGYTW